MMLHEIRAHFECDECGKRFSVGVDPASEARCAFEHAEGACRFSVDYKSDHDDDGSSVIGNLHLCATCADEAERRRIEDEA